MSQTKDPQAPDTATPPAEEGAVEGTGKEAERTFPSGAQYGGDAGESPQPVSTDDQPSQ